MKHHVDNSHLQLGGYLAILIVALDALVLGPWDIPLEIKFSQHGRVTEGQVWEVNNSRDSTHVTYQFVNDEPRRIRGEFNDSSGATWAPMDPIQIQWVPEEFRRKRPGPFGPEILHRPLSEATPSWPIWLAAYVIATVAVFGRIAFLFLRDFMDAKAQLEAHNRSIELDFDSDKTQNL